MPDQQIAVLIDYENVGPSALQWVLDQVSDLGRATVKRAYADWVAMRDQANQLVELGIEPIQMFRVTRGGKNSSDMRLIIDAIELLYQSPVDTFVIVSSDSDFVALVRKLRSAGKTVIGAGRKATAVRALVASCDRYFYLDDRAEPEQPSPSRSRRTTRVAVSPQLAPREDSLLVRAVRATMDEQGRAIGSRVFQAIQRMDPAFDFHALGFSTFTRYLEGSPEVKATRAQGPGDTVVELAESRPVGTPSPVRPAPIPQRRRLPHPAPVRQETPAPPPTVALAPAPLRQEPFAPLPFFTPAPAQQPTPLQAPIQPAVAQPAPILHAPVQPVVVQPLAALQAPAQPSDVEAPPAQSSLTQPVPPQPVAPQREQPLQSWDVQVDASWTRRAARRGGRLPGSVAAADAAKVLGAENLRSTQYKTLEKLLEASRVLQARWQREGNGVARKGLPPRLLQPPSMAADAPRPSSDASGQDVSDLPSFEDERPIA